ncbi:IS3 family transposase [Burkholderia sp. HI2714]|uniref:IS3 family transposase n=1 Tax=Burkholderia sp. HI2714 TaxID=2015359 RepID=UPI000B79E770|nr:IS3 family transposase [Burkholderia sp. HI2714]OXJ37067.1 IS3 family transposase [Burkholderia sp. HI2714]
MEQGIKRTQRDYSLAFKLSVVAQVEKGDLTYKEAQRRYGIQGRSTVLVWLRKHGLQDWADPSGRARSGSTMPKQDSKPLTPEQRIKELETQLREAREKAALFEAVIDVMRKDYGITVKKPSGVVAQRRVEKLSVERACRYMGISRQAYYKRCQSEARRCSQAETVTSLVQNIRLRQPRLGTRKLHHLLGPTLVEHGIKLGRDRLFDVLRTARLLVAPHRAYHKTTHSHHRFRRHPNLLKAGPEQIVPKAPEQVWVADITYLPTAGPFVYLSLVTDAFSRKIVGYHVHDSLQTEQVSQALKKALRTRRSRQPLIHHSDRGIQYCSTYYQDIHRRHGLRCSMTDGYDCYQNALAERINGILKGEFLLHRPADLKQAAKMVEQSVNIYNCERPHAALKYKTPDAVHRAFSG